MSHRQQIPKEFEASLADLADLFDASRDAFFLLADQFHWEPAPGSGAAAAAKDLPSPDPDVAEPRGETGHRLISEVVSTYLLTAAGHLGGLASLHSSSEVIFPTSPLIRAVIENCSHVVWVIGRDHEEASEDRLARAYLEELLSAEEAKKNAGRLGPKTSPTHRQAEDNYNALKAQILARFDTDTQTLGARTLNGQTFPRLEECVAFMYSIAEEFGSPIDNRAALGIYGLLSNQTHPTLYPARQLRVWADDPIHGHRVAYLKVDLAYVERQARAALAAFYNAMNWVTSYFGWDTTVLDDLEVKIENRFPGFFV